MIKTKERPNVLLIENDQSLQHLFEVILDGCDWEVVSTDNGDAAVKEWKKKVFSGILLDLDLPHLSGLEVARLIRHIERDRHLEPTPIIGITGTLSDTERHRCLASGMNGFITKPIRPEELCSTVSRYFCH